MSNSKNSYRPPLLSTFSNSLPYFSGSEHFTNASAQSHQLLSSADSNGSVLPGNKRTKSDHFIVNAPEDWERRPSFLGFGGILTGATLRHQRENEKLINYVKNSNKILYIGELRTHQLIGDVDRLYQWNLSIKNDSYLKSLKNRKLRKFYEEQNDLIKKYEEIDKLLDSGIHYRMIRNYNERNDEEAEVPEPYIDTNDINVETQGLLSSNGNDYGSTNKDNGSANGSGPPTLHRRQSAVPGNIDLETGDLLGYNKEEEIKFVDFYILLNFITNIVLLIGKIVVAILTSSISIVASLIDSALDFLSTVIIYFSNKLGQSKHSNNFPVGKNRLEPIGVLVFSVIIIVSFLQVGIQAINKIIYDGNKEIVEIGWNSSMIMMLTIVSKLACYIYGKTIKSSSAQALAQDALVDVIFNIFSLLMPILGFYFQIYWFDPVGAFLLSTYVVYLWTFTCFEHIIRLTGHKADPEDYKVILYLCTRFAEKISKIKDINCYHVGDSINVEIDLVLDGIENLRDSHDLAEALQYTLEALPSVNIERAFVHTDYKVDNFKGHLRG